MLAELLRQSGELSEAQISALDQHYTLLQKWNRVLNLTTVERVEEAVARHYGEALFLGRHLPPGKLSIVDIGSGAGFPGIPVAVLRPECQVTLVESHQRKAVFLKEATRGMLNVRVLAKRAEDVGERFDWAISRAVSYDDLRKALGQMAPCSALLTGADPPPDWLGFEWDAPIPLPWGRHRFLRLGRLVSRETRS